MIHPSYVELMKVVNNGVEIGEEPVVNSRYSIVLATAKRARQIIAGDEPLIAKSYNKKPLSIAVEELYTEKVRILTEDEWPDEEFENVTIDFAEDEEIAEETEEQDSADAQEELQNNEEENEMEQSQESDIVE